MANHYTPYPKDEEGMKRMLASAIEGTEEELALGKNPLISYTPSPGDLDELQEDSPGNNDPSSNQSSPSRRPR